MIKPASFYRQHFGLGSSHPDAQLEGARFFSRLALLPLVALVGIAVFVVVEAPRLLFNLTAIKTWVSLAIASGVFAAGVTATLGLCARVADIKVRRAKDTHDPPDQIGTMWVWLGIFFGVVFPIVAPNLEVLPDSLRFACRLVAILPMLLLLLWVARNKRPSSEVVATNRTGASLLLLPVAAVLVHSILVSIFDRTGSSASWVTLSGYLPFLADLPGRIGSWSVLLPMFFILQCLRRVWPRWLPHQEAERRERKWKGGGLWRSLVRWVLRALGWLPKDPLSVEADKEGEGEDAECPAWVDELIGEEGPWEKEIRRERVVEGAESSPLERGRPELEILFNNEAPTRDQAQAVERFLEVYAEAVGAYDRGEALPSTDLILQGEQGSGRSSTLIACGLAAIALRGQGVLVMAPGRLQRSIMRRRIEQALEALGLAGFVRADELTRAGVQGWLVPNTEDRQDEEAAAQLPDIIVATPKDLEKYLFGASTPTLDHRKALRRVMSHFEVLLVDDLDAFEGTARCHLPFLLDKLRLVHAAEMRVCQAVIVTGRLSTAAAPVLGKRLLGLRRFSMSRNLLRIRPRALEPFWKVSLTTTQPRAAREALVRRAVGLGLNTVVYVRGIDPSEVEVQKERLTGAGRGRVDMISHPDEACLLDLRSADLGLLTESLRHPALLQLRAQIDDLPVIVALCPMGQVSQTGDPETVPLLPPRNAAALSAAHLESVLRVIPAEQPIPLSAWADLGFIPKRAPKRRYIDREACYWWVDELPQDDSVAPMVILEGEAPGPPELDTDRLLPNPPAEVVEDPEHDCFVLVHAEESEAALRGRALWVDGEDTRLGTVELPHAGVLELSLPNNHFIPSRVEEHNERLHLYATTSLGEEQDYAGQVIELEFKIREGSVAKPYFNVPDANVAWWRIGHPDGGEVGSVQSHLVGLANSYGGQNQTARYGYEYSANVSALLLGPRKLSPEELIKSVEQALVNEQKPWGTRDDARHLPALSTALTYSFSRHLKGFEWFSRVVAFALEGESRPADAVAFVLEPPSTGRATLETLDHCLRDPVTRRNIFLTADWALQQLEGSGDRAPELARALTSPSLLFEGDGRVEESIAIVEPLTEALEKRRAVPGAWRVQDPGEAPHETIPAVMQDGRGWDSEGEITPWDACVDHLWRTAAFKFPSIVEVTAGQWDTTISFEMRVEGPGEIDWDAAASDADTDPSLKARWSDGWLIVTPESSADGEAFRVALLGFLQGNVKGWKLDLSHTVSLRLLGLKGGVRPRPGVPPALDVVLQGGFHSAGLILRREAGLAPERRTLPPSPHKLTAVQDEPTYLYPTSAEDLEGVWSPGPAGVPRPDVEGGTTIRWSWCTRKYELSWGFPDPVDGKAWIAALDAIPARASEAWDNHALNDPYIDSIHTLADRLLQEYGGTVDADFAEFLLSFVQAMPYIPDPEMSHSDWPRFPSEFLVNGGGDCEDSTILLVALLLHFGFDPAYVRMVMRDGKGHLAVGIAGPYSDYAFDLNGESYFYAETAMDASQLPLGTSNDEIGEAEVIPSRLRELPRTAPVSILGTHVIGDDRVTCTLRVNELPSGRLRVAFQLRSVDEPNHAPVILVAVELPADPTIGACFSFEVPISVRADIPPGKACLDATVWDRERLVTRWLGLAQYTFTQDT